MNNEQVGTYSYSSNLSGGAVKTGLTYFLVGGGIGAVVALLFAPKAGGELRGEIADVTKRGLDATKEKANSLSAGAIGTLRGKADEIYQYAKRRGKSEEALELETFETAMAEDNVRELPSHAEARASGRKASSIM